MKRFSFLLLLLLSACGDAAAFENPMSTGGRGGVAGGAPRGTGGAGAFAGAGAGGWGGRGPCQGVICDDGNACTEDDCDPATGQCRFDPASDGTACDFPGGAGVCEAGICQEVDLCADVRCDDGLECTLDDCDPLDGSCFAVLAPESTSCAQGAGYCLLGSCAEPVWGAPRAFGVTSGGGTRSPLPQVATDASGRAVAVWLARRRDQSWTVVSSRYTAEIGWSPISGLGVGQDSDADAVDLAVSANGEAIAIWVQHETPPAIYANRYKPDRGWGLPLLVENNRALLSQHPQIAMDASGNGIAVWLRAGRIHANHFDAAGVWGEPQLIGLETEGASAPRIGMDAEGNATVVWVQSGDLYAAHFLKNLGWQVPGRIESAGTPRGSTLDLAVNAKGDAVAVWMQRANGEDEIFAKRYTLDRGWNGAELVAQSQTAMFTPRVAIAPDGSAALVWDQLQESSRQVLASHCETDGGWTLAAPISDPNQGDADSPSLAMDAEGRALAVWSCAEGPEPGLHASRFLPASGWAASQRAAAAAEQQLALFAPSIALDERGRGVMLWVVLAPQAQYEVWASRFE